MMNLLSGRRFSGARSPESEVPHQPIKIGQPGDIDLGEPRDIAAQIAGSSIQAEMTIATPGSASMTATSLPERRSAYN
jgi:hypothetical protein